MDNNHSYEIELRKQKFLEKYSFLLTIGTYILVVIMLVYSFIKDQKDILYLIAGFVVGSGLKDATGFWFGSSLVSRDKDRTITTLTDKQKEDTLNVSIQGMNKVEKPDATIVLSKDEPTELAELEATENRTEDQEKRLQELKQKIKNV